jgi:hypothetical protein
MSDELPIAVGYNKIWGGFMLVAGVFILGTAILIGQIFPQAITGTILLLVSLGYLTQPAFVVTRTEVQMRNLFGMTLRTHPFEKLSQLSVVDGRVEVNGTPVKFPRWLIAGSDLEQLETYLRKRRE